MKLIHFFALVLLFTSCHDGGESEVGELLQGKHELRRFKVVNESGYRMSGSYFLLSGSTNGETYEDTKIAFSFRLADSTYAMAELDFTKVRVKIDSTIQTPYVTFRWRKGSETNMDYIMLYHVNYMVVHCKDEDYPYDVRIEDL